MKLRDCTKAELLWVIQRAREHSLGSINGYIDHALSDLRFQRADKLDREYLKIMREVDKL